MGKNIDKKKKIANGKEKNYFPKIIMGRIVVRKWIYCLKSASFLCSPSGFQHQFIRWIERVVSWDFRGSSRISWKRTVDKRCRSSVTWVWRELCKVNGRSKALHDEHFANFPLECLLPSRVTRISILSFPAFSCFCFFLFLILFPRFQICKKFPPPKKKHLIKVQNLISIIRREIIFSLFFFQHFRLTYYSRTWWWNKFELTFFSR